MAGTKQTTKATTPQPAGLTDTQRTAILKALADPRRFELLELIAKNRCPLGCSKALAEMPISAATLSHHIKELELVGLIEVRREGKYAFLSLRPGVLEAVASTLSFLESAGCPPAHSSK